MKPLLCIRHEQDVPLGVIEDFFLERRVPYVCCDAYAVSEWPSVEEASALIVLGGSMSADEIDRYPFLAETRRLIRRAVDRDLPLMGICLGSQLLARELGAPVRRLRRRNAGFHPLAATEAGLADPLIAPFVRGGPVLHFHEDTFDVPASGELLLTGAGGTNQAFRTGKCAYGVQFHFEITEREIKSWTDSIGPEALARDWGTSQDRLLSETSRHLEAQQQNARRLMQKFLGLAGLRTKD